MIFACCGPHFKALKSSCALCRESGHEAWKMKCFSPSVSLGQGDFVFPHIRKSEIM